MYTSRRKFLTQAAATTALAAAGPVALAGPPKATADLFKLGIAGFSFVNFDLEKSLEMMRKLEVHYLCIKDFHLPLKADEAQVAAFHEKLKASDVTGYGVGPIYMKTKEEIDNGFAYAKRVGTRLMVGIPNPELLPLVNEKVKQYNIRYAIHNHGPDIELFPNAKSVWDAVKNMDERMGLCFDMGHDRRYGDDPVADLERYHKRIFDIHLKNVTAASKEGKTCELGRGVIDIPAFVKMLRKVKYSGCCSLEYEKDMKDPLAGLAESVGYFRGVCDATR